MINWNHFPTCIILGLIILKFLTANFKGSDYDEEFGMLVKKLIKQGYTIKETYEIAAELMTKKAKSYNEYKVAHAESFNFK